MTTYIMRYNTKTEELRALMSETSDSQEISEYLARFVSKLNSMNHVIYFFADITSTEV